VSHTQALLVTAYLLHPIIPYSPVNLISSLLCRYEDESDTGVDRNGFTLFDMVAWSLAHPSSATDGLLDLIQELRMTTEYPVLVAIDGQNLLYDQSPYPYEGKTLTADRLSIPAALQCFGPNGFRCVPPCSLILRNCCLVFSPHAHSLFLILQH
jgi:hypothetical protein